VGERELFIRFCECNLSCPYCDTRYALTKAPTCLVEREAGIREFAPHPNPMEGPELIRLLPSILKDRRTHHSVVLTGGEPLLWSQFLTFLLPQIRRDFNLPITLETNGTLPAELARILPLVDIISMDYKLPSTLGGEDYSEMHKKFLTLAKGKDTFLKFVLTSTVEMEELRKAFQVVRAVGDFPIVLQPVSPQGDIKPPSEVALLKMQGTAKVFFSLVKVLPQVHRLMGAR